MNEKDLIRNVKSKNRVSNILIALKAVFDLAPQFFIIHMVANLFAGSLTKNIVVIDISMMVQKACRKI